jgi:predicted deacylase
MKSPYPIELTPPDIEPWRQGNAGIPFVHVLDSGRPGPNVMIQALTHGNEYCGAIALCELLAAPPALVQGTLTLVFANVAAFARFDAADPNASRYVDEDYNRVWADAVLDGPRDSAELRRARELRPFVDAADLLLDIHSMHEPCRPLMVCGTADKNARYAQRLGLPADLLLDTGHPSGLRMVERGGFSDALSPKQALLIECGQHWERSAADVAHDSIARFLVLSGVVDAASPAEQLRLPLPATQRLVRVTEAVLAESADFHFLVPMLGFGVVEKAGTPIARDGDTVWLAPYDNTVLVMPSLGHLLPGNTQVRLGRFVD